MTGVDGGLVVLDHALGPAVLVLVGLVAVRRLAPAVLGRCRRLPGATGHLSRRAARWLRPGLSRRLLAVAVGVAAPVAGAPAAVGAPAAAAQARPAPARLPHADPTRPAWVVVSPGDTLWGLARRHLHRGATDAEIARDWPRWYAANRSTIGPDPNLLLPGTRLRVPEGRPGHGTAPRPAGTPAQHHRPASHPVDASSLDPDRR